MLFRSLEEVLLQVAVSGLETPVAGLVWMLERAGNGVEEAAVEEALERLAALSLVVRPPSGGVWVHRWTAEGLASVLPQKFASIVFGSFRG